MSIVSRGLVYPATRQRQAYRIVPQRTLTRGQIMLVQAIKGEEEWTRWVKSRADVWGWQGYHVRDSEGVMESVHTLHLHRFSEGLGVPDWRFWHEDLGQNFDVELKGVTGGVHPRQRREHASMRKGGIVVFVWYPRDWLTAERVFQHGLAAA